MNTNQWDTASLLDDATTAKKEEKKAAHYNQLIRQINAYIEEKLDTIIDQLYNQQK